MNEREDKVEVITPPTLINIDGKAAVLFEEGIELRPDLDNKEEITEPFKYSESLPEQAIKEELLKEYCGNCKTEKVNGKCEKCSKTNPNGANQWIIDPRQKLCWDYYVSPKSETFANGLQSALKAGYSPSHAKTITTEEWFQDRVRRMNMLRKAERVFDKTLDYEPVDEEGSIKVDLLRVQTDVAKHVSSTLGKNDGYSTRQEVTGADGEDLFSVDKETKEKVDKVLNEYITARIDKNGK